MNAADFLVLTFRWFSLISACSGDNLPPIKSDRKLWSSRRSSVKTVTLQTFQPVGGAHPMDVVKQLVYAPVLPDLCFTAMVLTCSCVGYTVRPYL